MSEFHWGHALLLFLALFALYSPIAALSSYLPYMDGYSPKEQLKLSFGLFRNVTVLMLLALWVGEPLLELLGISTAALSATGGIALILAAVPMMTGSANPPPPRARRLTGARRRRGAPLCSPRSPSPHLRRHHVRVLRRLPRRR
ncbi:MarC family protein [Streptomyces kaempferi]